MHNGSSFTIFGNDYDTRDGTAVRDFVHITDLVRAHVAALEALEEGVSHVYSIGSGTGHTVKEVLETARAVSGRDIACTMGERRPGDPPVLVASSQRIERELGWRAEHTDLAEIVRSAWNWHNTHPNGFGD